MTLYSFDRDLVPMTLILKLELDMVEMNLCTEMKFLAIVVQKL